MWLTGDGCCVGVFGSYPLKSTSFNVFCRLSAFIRGVDPTWLPPHLVKHLLLVLGQASLVLVDLDSGEAVM